MNFRALGLENVWLAASPFAAYASTSTTFPATPFHTSSHPINSRAQVSGSRRKNSRPMNPGDLVEVEVTGLGRLSNKVVEAPAPVHKVGHQPTDGDSVRRVALGSDWVRTEARQTLGGKK